MKIQLINSSKLKIFFNKIDLAENNISVHNFLSRSQISQNFINAIIEIAYEDFGFDIKDNNFAYEIFCFDLTDFIIIVSKELDTVTEQHPLLYRSDHKQINTFIDNNINGHLSFKFSQNKLFKNENLFFFFDNFEDFLNFSVYLKNSMNLKNINSILYKYNNIFLLEIITSNLLENELNILLFNSLEAKTNSHMSTLGLIRFKEFAEILIYENALNL